ncbi:MAG: Uma2 family endonuclease [bacterium]|nr:Uma2 family endonuclease [bacterium]
MGLAVKKETPNFTYADYLSWDDGERWELIDGEAYNMSPAPVVVHQRIQRKLLVQLSIQLESKTCEAFGAPLDVLLPLADENENDISNVVQPDISVICDSKKLDSKSCIGAPDFIIEILSPTSRRRDRLEKFNLYETAGVKEYWLVDPEAQLVEVFTLEPNGSYGKSRIYTESDTIELSALKDITIDLNDVLKNIAPAAV